MPANNDVFTTGLLALLKLADKARQVRANARPCFNITWDGVNLTAICDGAKGAVHRPRIRLAGGKRTFGCTCQDHRKQLGQVGPCKHVISLALAALDDTNL